MTSDPGVSTEHKGERVEGLGEPAPDDKRHGRRASRWVVAAVVVALLGVAAAAALARSPRSRFAGGGRALAFELPDVRDAAKKVSLPERPGRLTVLNFWASWCVPCRKEMPDLQAVHRAMGDRVAFLGIDHQDARQDAAAFLRQTGVTYPSGYDPEGSIAQRYGVRGLPTTIVIDAGGQVLGHYTGPVRKDQLLRELRAAGSHPTRETPTSL